MATERFSGRETFSDKLYIVITKSAQNHVFFPTWAIVEAKVTKDFYMLKIMATLVENDNNIDTISMFAVSIKKISREIIRGDKNSLYWVG